jgi:hypothetical protein
MRTFSGAALAWMAKTAVRRGRRNFIRGEIAVAVRNLASPV